MLLENVKYGLRWSSRFEWKAFLFFKKNCFCLWTSFLIPFALLFVYYQQSGKFKWNLTSNMKQMEFHYYYNEFGLKKAKFKQRSMYSWWTLYNVQIAHTQVCLSLFANSFWSTSSCNKQFYVSKPFSKSQII